MRETFIWGEGWSADDGNQGMWWVMPQGNRDPERVIWYNTKSDAVEHCKMFNRG